MDRFLLLGRVRCITIFIAFVRIRVLMAMAGIIIDYVIGKMMYLQLALSRDMWRGVP